jgi:hypothetical protein
VGAPKCGIRRTGQIIGTATGQHKWIMLSVKQSRSLLAGRPRARVLHSRDIGQISTLSYMLGNLAAINGQEPAVRDLAAKGFISEQLAHAQQLPSDWDPPIGLHLT